MLLSFCQCSRVGSFQSWLFDPDHLYSPSLHPLLAPQTSSLSFLIWELQVALFLPLVPFYRMFLQYNKIIFSSSAAAFCFLGTTSHCWVQVGVSLPYLYCGQIEPDRILQRAWMQPQKSLQHSSQPGPVDPNWFDLPDNKSYLWTDSSLCFYPGLSCHFPKTVHQLFRKHHP